MITVIAGVNGAGKSSIVGSHLRARGGDYYNPDEVARGLLRDGVVDSQEQANSKAWQMGYEQLQQAIVADDDYIFETTLGGHSICQALHNALDVGRQVRIFYCGLASPELHIQRVGERVARGGHPIPEEKIRERWQHSIRNMIGLIPRCQAVRVFDNSMPADDLGPNPVCLFSIVDDQFDSPPVKLMPDWAKPLATVAIRRVMDTVTD